MNELPAAYAKNIFGKHEQMQARFNSFFAEWKSLQADMGAAGCSCLLTETLYRINHNEDNASEELSRTATKTAWFQYLNHFKLYDCMRVKEERTLNSQIQNNDFMAFTPDNALRIFNQIRALSQKELERGLVESIDALCGDWRTNQHHMLGNKVIVDHASPSNVLTRDVMIDLVRSFFVLDGVEYPGRHKLSIYNVRPYMEFAFYPGANTAHIVFKRQDLVDQANAIYLAHCPGALPPRKKLRGN